MYLLYDLVYATLCPFSFTIILLGKREQVALLSFSSYSLMIAVWHFIVVPCLSAAGPTVAQLEVFFTSDCL